MEWSEFRTLNSYPTKNSDYYLTLTAFRISDPSTRIRQKNDYYLTWKAFRISDPSTALLLSERINDDDTI